MEALAAAGFAPKFYGCFANGRLEGWLPAKPLDPSELGAAPWRSLIATKLAEMHELSVPTIPTTEPILWSKLDEWSRAAQGVVFSGDIERTRDLNTCGFPGAVEALAALRQALPSPANEHGKLLLARRRHTLSRAGHSEADIEARIAARACSYRQVLAHNDLLAGNVLVPEGGEHRVHFIDFEYGGTNYAGFDWGNHFCEWAGFDFDLDKWYPKKHVAKQWLQAYVSSLDSGYSKLVDNEAAMDEMVMAANEFALASHLFWGFWAVIQSGSSTIDFNFLKYARARFEGLAQQATTALPMW